MDFIVTSKNDNKAYLLPSDGFEKGHEYAITLPKEKHHPSDWREADETPRRRSEKWMIWLGMVFFLLAVVLFGLSVVLYYQGAKGHAKMQKHEEPIFSSKFDSLNKAISDIQAPAISTTRHPEPTTDTLEPVTPPDDALHDANQESPGFYERIRRIVFSLGGNSFIILTRRSFTIRQDGEQPQGEDTGTPPHEDNPCQDPEWFPFESKRYLVNNKEKLSFEASRAWCRDHGGDLASIHGKELQDEIIKKQRDGNLWIGMKRNEKGVLDWLDHTNKNFTCWASGEPNSQDEKCVELKKEDGHWNDRDCSTINGFVCEAGEEESDREH